MSARNYLDKFDVVAAQETWLVKEREKEWLNKLDKKYKWGFKAAAKENKKGRAMGGVLIGVKKGIKLKEIEEWGYGLTIKGVNIDIEKKMNIIVVYNNIGMRGITEELKKEVENSVMEGNAVLVIGDFNARIGRWNLNIENEMVENRNSEDDITNAEGKKLLDFCEEIGGTIKNGNSKGDWEGKLTYVGGEVGSVLDLIIEIETERGSIVEEIKVEPRIESDHLPVEIHLEGKGAKTIRDSRKRKEFRLKWDGRVKEEYKRALNERAEGLVGSRLTVHERWTRLVGVIWETGRELKLVKALGEGGGEERDGDIKAQKKRVNGALKRWVKEKRAEDKEELKEEKRRLREIRKAKKEEEKEKKIKRVENSRNMSDFWEAIRGFRTGRKRKGERIEKDKWTEHFKNLLEGGETEEGFDRVESEVEEGVEEMEKDIELEEVKKVLRGMKNGKAAGEDGVPIEFLKYLPETWLREVSEILNEIYKGKDMVEGWKVARIFPIHKEGDEEDVKNYRGVSLLDSGYKLYTTILEKRIRAWMEREGKIGESQAGFREKGGLETMFSR